MRIASVALFLLFAAPALAQDPPIPDTTAAWLYYPLGVGNVWEYESFDTTFGTRYERRVIPRDTTVNGTRYAVREDYRSNSDYTAWELQRVSLLRFDTLSTQVVRWTGSQEVFETCPFGADFNDIVDCQRYEEDVNHVFGSYIEIVHVGGDTVPVLAEKIFYPKGPVDVDVPIYVAPIGFHHVSFWICTFCQHDLVYTRIMNEDGTVMEYGSPTPVATEPPVGSPSTLTVSVFPNPSSGPVTLDLAVPSPQAVTVTVFDALGRRVHAEERMVGGTAQLRLDGRAWAPGVYVVRVITEDGTTASVWLVRR